MFDIFLCLHILYWLAYCLCIACTPTFVSHQISIVLCLLEMLSSVSAMDNNFSHKSAAGDAGVLRVDENVTFERSIFSNNAAGGNGGVFHTYFYPTSYIHDYPNFLHGQPSWW